VVRKPEVCRHCRHPLSGADPRPLCHQVTELPPVVPEVREYRRHTLTCARCGQTTLAELPPGVPPGCCGPRLQAHIALHTGSYHLSKRQVQQQLRDCFHIDLALGTISNVEKSVSAAVAGPVAEVHRAVQQQPSVNADETSWRQPGKAWLWVAVTTQLAIFSIRNLRDAASAQALLGPSFGGIATTDRYSSYSWLGDLQRQFCWAHLRRDWQAMIDRGGASAELGRPLLALTDQMFRWWYKVRDGTWDRTFFRIEMSSVRRRVGELLRQGRDCAHAKTAGTCEEILRHEGALWTFVEVAGVEPTNNAAERALRQAVLWRKKSQGTRGASGSRYVERMLSVVTTCRLQGRKVLDYVTAAVEASLSHGSAPSLLPPTRGARVAS
jgi:transposase